MIKNNKGVTLVELLIVIVVMGIIAAFAIPAVGTIIDNTKEDAVIADAMAIENGARLYCASTQCEDGAILISDVEDFADGIDFGAATTVAANDWYLDSGVTTDANSANWTGSYVEKVGNDYYVQLEHANDGGYLEFGRAIPSQATRADVDVDAD